MRGDDPHQAAIFSDIAPEKRVPLDHPLRTMRVLVDAMLKDLSPQLALLYSDTRRPSIVPETLLRALRLPVLYTSRRERWLLEQLAYNLLCRWVVERNMNAPVWDSSPLSKTREQLREGDIATAFFAQVVAQARERELLSDAHSTVEGTLIEAWAGQKRFQRKPAAPPPEPLDDPGNPSIDFGGEQRTNGHPRLDDQSQRPPIPKGQGAGNQAGLSGPCPHGTLARPDGRYVGDAGDGDGQVRGRIGAGRGDSRPAAGPPWGPTSTMTPATSPTNGASCG